MTMLKQALMGLLLLAAVAAQAQTQVAKVDTKARAKVVRHSAKAPVHTAPAAEELAPVALSPEQMAVASKVLVGKIPCELSVNITMTPDVRSAGRFLLEMGHDKYVMTPVVTTTGAVRLEDAASGAVWIQVANKSMLMNQKLGKRLADACTHPEQLLVAQAMERSPVPGLLDDPKAAPVVTTAPVRKVVAAATK
jgi:hypothetical protein